MASTHQDATRQRRFERIDNIVCLTIFLTVSTPAIVVMLILALPILPFLAASLIGAASGRGGTADEVTGDTVRDDTHHFPPHQRPAPHFA